MPSVPTVCRVESTGDKGRERGHQAIVQRDLFDLPSQRGVRLVSGLSGIGTSFSSTWVTVAEGHFGMLHLGIANMLFAYYLELMQTISLKLPERLLALLEKEAQSRRKTKSSLIRECLEKSLVDEARGGDPSCYDLARDLAGSVRGLPRDLAVNPKYMEGFGR